MTKGRQWHNIVMDQTWPIFKYSPEKNLKLKQERNISFEEIIAAIENGQLVDIVKHENTLKYDNQKIYVVYAKNYIYLVPFIQDDEGDIFLKTIIPSRKAKQKYIKRG
jgi:hypothetical protein